MNELRCGGLSVHILVWKRIDLWTQFSDLILFIMKESMNMFDIVDHTRSVLFIEIEKNKRKE